MEERNEISVELSALSALVGGISRQTPYGVPVGYFGDLPAKVMSRIASQSTTFQVPDGYFDGFATQVLARIKAGSMGEEELPPVFSRISRVIPYQVPEGYFEELSPVLAVLRDRPAYAVPEGYFAGLPKSILERVAAPVTAARVIPMNHDGRKVLKGHWWKFSSVAAIAACLLVIVSWPQADTKHTEGVMTVDVAQALQKVSDQEMQAYLDDQH